MGMRFPKLVLYAALLSPLLVTTAFAQRGGGHGGGGGHVGGSFRGGYSGGGFRGGYYGAAAIMWRLLRVWTRLPVLRLRLRLCYGYAPIMLRSGYAYDPYAV